MWQAQAWTNAADAADSVDEDEDDVHLWSDKPPDDDDEEQPEYWEIISYDLPLFIFWCAVLIWIEVRTVCLLCGRFAVALLRWLTG